MTETTFSLTIRLGNDEMQTSDDVAYALRALADRLLSHSNWYDDRGHVRDGNGNTVGEWAVDAVQD